MRSSRLRVLFWTACISVALLARAPAATETDVVVTGPTDLNGYIVHNTSGWKSYATIYAALGALGTTPGTLILPAGTTTYDPRSPDDPIGWSDSLLMRENQHLMGAGKLNTVLQIIGYGMPDAPLIMLESVSQVPLQRIENLTIRGTGSYRTAGIHIGGGGTGVMIRNVIIENCMSGVYSWGRTEQLRLVDSTIRDCYDGGVVIRQGAAPGVAEIFIDRCEFYRISGDAIYVEADVDDLPNQEGSAGLPYISILNTRIHTVAQASTELHRFGNGIRLYARNTRIQNCEIDTVRNHGIQISNIADPYAVENNVSVENCTIVDAGSAVTQTTWAINRAANVRNAGACGIYIDGNEPAATAGFRIRKCYIASNAAEGIHCDAGEAAANLQFDGNIVHTNSRSSAAAHAGILVNNRGGEEVLTFLRSQFTQNIAYNDYAMAGGNYQQWGLWIDGGNDKGIEDVIVRNNMLIDAYDSAGMQILNFDPTRIVRLIAPNLAYAWNNQPSADGNGNNIY